MRAPEGYAGIPEALKGFSRVLQSDYFPAHREEILQSFIRASSDGQMRSKIWLIETLKSLGILSLGTVFLCAGWYGFLALFLLMERRFSINRIFLFEKDPLSVQVSEDINRRFVQDGWRFKATHKDILRINYTQETFHTLKANGEAQELIISPDTIINTSCEHIDSFYLWWSRIPFGKRVVLQSNNFEGEEGHVHCAASLKEFSAQAPLSRCFYRGALDLERYQRFMLIGEK